MTRGANAATSSEPDAGQRRRRHRPGLRSWLLVLAVLIVLAAAIGGTYVWTQSQYFVGKDGSEVAIFRGVNTAFGPLKFFNVYRNTDLRMSDLTPSARSQVIGGLTATDRADALVIVHNLHDQQLPVCGANQSPTGGTCR